MQLLVLNCVLALTPFNFIDLDAHHIMHEESSIRMIDSNGCYIFIFSCAFVRFKIALILYKLQKLILLTILFFFTLYTIVEC